MAANLLPLRLTICPSMSVLEIVEHTNRQISKLIQHQYCQIGDLRPYLKRSSTGRVMFGPAINIMRFKYDLNFAGNQSTSSFEVNRLPWSTRIEGLQMRLKPPRRRVMAKLRSDRSDATGPNQVWAMD